MLGASAPGWGRGPPRMEVLTPFHLEDLDVSHATFARPDLATFAGLDQGFQRPAQGPPRQFRPRLGSQTRVLAPHMAAAAAAIPTYRDLQHCGAPPERLMRQPSEQAVPRDPFAAAASAPLVGLADSAGQHRPIQLETLPDHDHAELVETGERGQVRGREGSVGHVEVFRAEGVGISIIERPRPSPPATHRQPHGCSTTRDYTPVCEEPRCRP